MELEPLQQNQIHLDRVGNRIRTIKQNQINLDRVGEEMRTFATESNTQTLDSVVGDGIRTSAARTG